MPKNNEAFGIAGEVAIAKTFNLSVNPSYASRGETETIDLLVANDIMKNLY